MGWTIFLLVYGFVSTIVTCILAALYAHCGTSENEKIVKGDSNSVTITEIGIIKFDNSLDNFSYEQPNCNCGLVELELYILEITLVG